MIIMLAFSLSSRVKILVPSWENEANWLPGSASSSAPDSASHTRTVRSSLAVTTFVPSRLNDADLTQSVCPLSSASVLPVAVSHTRAVLSALAVTTFDPS